MGDIIHSLPAVTDAMHAKSDIKFDWLIESDFAQIPAWHPAVNKIFSSEIRKKTGLINKIRHSVAIIRLIRKEKYDLVIDAQGLIKSAVFTKFAVAKDKVGFSWQSARESIAAVFYKSKYFVETNLHAIDRTRRLFSKALNYNSPKNISYGVNWQQFKLVDFPDKPYIMFLHGTTWQNKHWPEKHWLKLAKLINQHGFDAYMTWANSEQKERAYRLAKQSSNIKILPHLSINDAAKYINSATAIVAVDTGFGHLAAAINKPTISLYGPTDPFKVGHDTDKQLSLQSRLACSACLKRKCKLKQLPVGLMFPACMDSINPELVWKKLAFVLEH